MKIIGALIIIFSSVMISLNLCEKIDASVASVSALRTLFEHTKNMIECYSLPASEILRRFDEKLLLVLGYSKKEPPRDFCLLSESVYLEDSEARELLDAFSRDFGKGYRQDELARCSLYIEKMRAREQKLIKDSLKRKRVIFTVALCTALAVIILIV